MMPGERTPSHESTSTQSSSQFLQKGDGGMNTLRQIRNVISDEDNALLAHQGGQDVDEVLHIETRDQRSQLNVDQRSIHISRTDKFVLADVELGSVLRESSLATLAHKVEHLLRLQTSHRLGDLQNVRENGEVGPSKLRTTISNAYLRVTQQIT